MLFAKDPEAAPDEILVFNHIAKTAGTTLKAIIAASYEDATIERIGCPRSRPATSRSGTASSSRLGHRSAADR